jgi:hypothetical protein
MDPIEAIEEDVMSLVDETPHLDAALDEWHVAEFEDEIELHDWFGGD